MYPEVKDEKNRNGVISDDFGAAQKKYSKSSLYKDAWKRLKKNKLAMLGLGIVIVLILIAIFSNIKNKGRFITASK